MMTDTSLVSDESVIQKIVDLDYAAYRQGRPAMREIVEKVASLASEITDGFSAKIRESRRRRQRPVPFIQYS